MSKIIKSIILSSLGIILVLGSVASANVRKPQVSKGNDKIVSGPENGYYNNKTVTINAQYADYYVLDWNQSDLNQIITYPYNGAINQKWKMVYDSDEDAYYITTTRHDANDYLTSYHLGASGDNQIINGPQNGIKSMLWKLEWKGGNPGDYSFKLKNDLTGKVIQRSEQVAPIFLNDDLSSGYYQDFVLHELNNQKIK